MHAFLNLICTLLFLSDSSLHDPRLYRSFVYWKEGNSLNISSDTASYLTSQWLTRFVPSFLSLMVGFGLPLNILAIFIFLVKIKPKKPAVVYLLNLASADVLLLIVLPFKISYRFSGNNWMLGPEMCRFLTAIFFCNIYCSILLMMAISIDRFLAVVYPMQSLSWRTPRRASALCIAVWIIAIVGMIPLLITEQTMWVPQLNITTCHDLIDIYIVSNIFRYYASAISVIFFFIPLIISTTCYVCIIRNLSSSTIAAKPDKKRRAILLSIAVLCSFIVSFGPTNTLLLMQNVGFSQDQHLESFYFAQILAVSIGTINCCIDPLIYYYASSKCQRQIWNLLRCKKHLGKGSETSSSHASTFSSGLNYASSQA